MKNSLNKQLRFRTIKVDIRDPEIAKLVEIIEKNHKERVTRKRSDPKYIVRVKIGNPSFHGAIRKSEKTKEDNDQENNYSQQISFEYKY